MKNLKVVIIDDDAISILLLKKYIQKSSSKLYIVYVANIIEDGIKLIKKYNPGVVFLNAIVAGQNTFNLLDEFKESRFHVIIISLYEKFAIKAIKYQALDYILKPIEENQIVSILTLINIQSKIQKEDKEFTTTELVFLPIVASEKIELLPIEDIIYCEADNKHTIFYLVDGTLRESSKNLSEYEKLLEDRVFFRIHHKYLVNLNRVININLVDNTCKFLDCNSLPISKRKKSSLYKLLKI